MPLAIGIDDQRTLAAKPMDASRVICSGATHFFGDVEHEGIEPGFLYGSEGASSADTLEQAEGVVPVPFELTPGVAKPGGGAVADLAAVTGEKTDDTVKLEAEIVVDQFALEIVRDARGIVFFDI